MNCGCTYLDKLCNGINPCSPSVSLGIEATETGSYGFYVSFDGVTKYYTAMQTTGEDISVYTGIFNEDYVHDLRIVQPSGDETCRIVSTSLLYNPSITPLPPQEGIWQWFRLAELEGDVIQSELFEGELSPELWFNGQGNDWQSQGIIHDPEAGTLDFTAVGGFEGVLSGQYKL